MTLQDAVNEWLAAPKAGSIKSLATKHNLNYKSLLRAITKEKDSRRNRASMKLRTLTIISPA